jgi:hypothetical protein
MGTLPDSDGGAQAAALPNQARASAAGALLTNLDLPQEVSTQEAATILGCCKHTVLQYREEGLLEWRNTAPPSGNRAIYRYTLRSVLDLRLGYQRGDARPPRSPDESKRRRKTANPSTFKPKHLRRKEPEGENGGATANR